MYAQCCYVCMLPLVLHLLVWSMHVGILAACSVCPLLVLVSLLAVHHHRTHAFICSLINACMLHDHMLSSKANANDKVLIQAKGAVRANNRIRSCTDSPVR